jgi:hypothetical protein
VIGKLTQKLGRIGLAAIVVSAMSLAPAAASASAETAAPAAADASCGGLVCVWFQPNFSEVENFGQCSTGIQQVPGSSAINGCGNRPVWLLTGTAQTGWHQLVCMNPGGERPNPGSFNGIEVLNAGERC